MAFVVTKRTDSGLPQRGSRITLSDEALNDQDKTLDYDADIAFGSMAFIQAMRVEYMAGGGAGSRPIEITIRDSGGDVIRQLDLNAAVASGGNRFYQVSRGLAPLVPSNDHDTLPDGFVLLPGQNMRVRATENEEAGDDMQLHVSVQVF